MCGKTLNPNHITAIFGVVKSEENLFIFQKKAIAFASRLARRIILFKWTAISTIPSTFIQWVKETMASLKL